MFLFYLFIYLFRLHQVLVVAHGIFSCRIQEHFLVAACGLLSCGIQTSQLWHANSQLWHACGIQFPDQGSNPGPLHWECGILPAPGTTREVPSLCFWTHKNTCNLLTSTNDRNGDGASNGAEFLENVTYMQLDITQLLKSKEILTYATTLDEPRGHYAK